MGRLLSAVYSISHLNLTNSFLEQLVVGRVIHGEWARLESGLTPTPTCNKTDMIPENSALTTRQAQPFAHVLRGKCPHHL